MRHALRLLLTRNFRRSSPLHSHHQVPSSSSSAPLPPALASSFHALSRSHFTGRSSPGYPLAYSFSTEALVEPRKDPDGHLVVSDVFVKNTDLSDAGKELEMSGVVVSHDLVLKVLKSLNSDPDAARRFFGWVLETDEGKLSSKGYNLILGILGVNGFVEEFWGLVESMKKKGYGVSKVTRDRVMEKFEKEGLKSDIERLKGVYASGSIDNSAEKIGLKVSRIVRNQVWGEEVEGKIRDLNVWFSSDLVKIVLENLSMEPSKALIFFRWVEESGLYKHDESSYNAMARVLGREDCIDRFWVLVEEMRSHKYEMEEETYVKVLGRFVKRKLMKDAVDLYEVAMGGANRPSVKCCTFLLRKIAVGKQLDMDLFSKVLKVFIGNGRVITDSMLEAVLKSLTSVGRFGECNKVLKEMKEGGYVAGSNLQSKIAFRLSSAGKKGEASEFVDHIESSGNNLYDKAWSSLIEGHCASGDLDKATESFQKMIGQEGPSRAAFAFNALVNGYCQKNRAIDACKLLQDHVRDDQIKPWHKTYQLLITNLLVQGGFNKALNLLDLMKDHGFPPFVGPFILHISKSGSGGDAIAFMKAMTSKKFPSTSVVLRLFEAFFKAGRHSEAQDFLHKCPGYIRNHADVLNLFCSMKSRGKTAPKAVPS